MSDGLLKRLLGRGRRSEAGDEAPAAALEDVRRRLELLLAALYGRPIPVAAAEPPRPPGALRRLFRRVPRHLAAADLLPASDGERVLLPPRLSAEGDGDPVARYRLLAVQQAEGLARGTAAGLAGDEPPLVRDLYLLAESAAVEDTIARTAPGLAPAQAAERSAALRRRPALDALTAPEREVERLVRGILAGSADHPASATPADSLAWARATAARVAAAGSRYRGVPLVAAWGMVLPAGAAAAAGLATRPDVMLAERQFWGIDTNKKGAGAAGRESDRPQSAQMVEEVKAGESDPPESLIESPAGGATVHSADAAAAPKPIPPDNPGIAYAEWDCYAGGYVRPGAWVRIAAPAQGDGEWGRWVLQAHAATVRRLREQFERLRARRQRLTAQRDGDELDLAACVRALVDLRTGHTVSDRLYAAVRPARRELAILLLVDISGSTTEYVNGVRIIDVEREALLLASEAFDALGDRYAVLTFSGKGPEHVRMRVVKHFSERNGAEVRGRVAALHPEGYTRMGAAVRHASALLAREGARHRLLLILSDGKPNDEDRYQGRYAVEDTRQAVAEARALGVFPFCVTVDQKGSAYLPRIFGPAGHMILHHPEHLPLALLKVVRGLLRG
ncbi:MAG TPA: VWA domain-containing protein [Longimicrobium sp.]